MIELPYARGLAIALVIAAGFVTSADRVQAAPCSSFNSALGAADTDDVQTSTDCYGLVNQAAPPQSIATSIPFPALGGWSFLEKYNAPNDQSTGAQFQGTYLNLTLNPPADDSKSGTWEIVNPIAGAQYALGLGSSARYAVYLLSGVSGTWKTNSFLNPPGNNTQGISNLSLYTATVIPLPAAAWLTLAGIGGLGLVARRRKTAA